MMPYLTIVIPTFNSAKTLENCLYSIVKQTFTDFDILLIDGMSTDATLKIIEQYQGKYDNVKYITEKDNGIYDAMNKGLKKANGKWIYFMGSDDSFFSVNTLNDLSKYLTGVDVVYGDVYSTRFNGRYDGKFDAQKIQQKNICHQAIFFKRVVFEIIGGFNTKYKSHADWDHNLRWFFSDRIKRKYIDLVIANYADGGFSSNNSDVFFSNVRNWKISLLRKNKISFYNKLIILKRELLNAFLTNRKRDLIAILLDIPKFIL